FPDIITANKSCDATPYYTNSSHLPVGFTEDIFSALDIQDDLQTLYTSGTVFHAFLGEKLPDWRSAANLVRKIAENYKLPYYTLSPTYSVCTKHGYLAGEQKTCPVCGGKTEVYSRITGYYRPVQNWNDGKTQEYKDRKTYDIVNSKLTHTGVLHPDTVSAAVPTKPAAETPAPAPADSDILLFATKTCPNCKIAAASLDKAGIGYKKLYADEAKELVEQYKIRQAPTLVVIDDTGIQAYAGVSEIKKFIGK
ncbi:MAG: ribonucleoside triphosphate reductase, partial [Clostridia bacterium]|nr:ribonucleoside triphosphate reductase [Clostridia bacterium]